MLKKFDGWPHVIYAQQFSREWLEQGFFPLTDEMEKIFEAGGCDILKNKRMISFFYEPSTRTRASFEFAMDYLGGRVVFSTENAREFSSAKKGEIFTDTVKVLNRYRPDAVAVRYDQEIGAEIAARVSQVPIINAGDRHPGQHPTQGLLDLRTILKLLSRIDGVSIAMVGDLTNGRTVRSLSYLLGKFSNVKIYFVSPETVKMKEDVKDYLRRHGIWFTELTDLRDVASLVDVIYQTRTQKECGSSFDRKDHNLGYFIVDKTILNLMKRDAIIMHPLPKVDEITPEVDEDPRAVYLTHQIDSGLFTRMALLKMIVSPDK
ncbi:MAG: aspartate carbamoyltransferase [Candidatus Staskawiczbacteria bacterium]|nr:aspartate carbamoyltransferase [Candidatus Staskawiczbacteria bacterium]